MLKRSKYYVCLGTPINVQNCKKPKTSKMCRSSYLVLVLMLIPLVGFVHAQRTHPSLQVIHPMNCSTICRRFSTFTLECKPYSPALLVAWFVPGQNNIQLSGIAGHTVKSQLPNGSVTVEVDSAMKYSSYACNVILFDGTAMASEKIEEEANEIFIGLSVKYVQANQATLEWRSSYTHCYNITCTIRNESSGIKELIELLEGSKTHNIPRLTPNTTYTIECTAERSHTRHSEELTFRSEESNFGFMSQNGASNTSHQHLVIIAYILIVVYGLS